MTHSSVVAFIAASIIMAAAAVACDGRREVVLEWPTPAVPVADIAYGPVIRSAGSAGLQDNPDPEALQQYYRARDEFLNAWRVENWPLAKESPPGIPSGHGPDRGRMGNPLPGILATPNAKRTRKWRRMR